MVFFTSGLSLIQVNLFFCDVLTPLSFLEHEDVKVVSGKIQINPLEQLVRVTDYEAKTVIYKDQQELVLGLDSRVFALEPVDNNGNVNK